MARTESAFESTPTILTPLIEALPSKLPSITLDQLRKYDRTMYALGNVTEMKAAVLIYGLTQAPTRTREIHERLQRSLPLGIPIPKKEPIRVSYLKESFCPTGVVLEYPERGCVYYATSNEGEYFTKGVGALFIKYAADTSILPSVVFGGTQTPDISGLRSYVTRAALLLLLDQQHTWYESELARKIGVRKENVGTHLSVLADLGLINYQFADPEIKGWGIYERVGSLDQVIHSPAHNRLRTNILEYFKVNSTGNPQTIVQAIGRLDEIDVYNVLSELTENGFLKRTQWHGGVKQSDARLLDKGKQYVEQLLLPLIYACAGDTKQLAFLSRAKAEVRANPNLSAQALTLAALAHERKPRSETKDKIIGFINANGPSRTKAFIDEFGGRVEPVLSELVHLGKLEKYEVGRASYYLLPGMPIPEYARGTIIFQYNHPEKLQAPTCYPKEKYAADLETVEFWQTLYQNLLTVAPQEATESDFFRFFDPQNPNWQRKDNLICGTYSACALALRELGIRNPYRFLREYRPNSTDSELVIVVTRVQGEIRARLNKTHEAKQWREYVEDFHTENFWQQLLSDINQAPDGLTMFQFLAYHSHKPLKVYDSEFPGKYHNLYAAMARCTGHGQTYLRDFKPVLPHSEQLNKLITKTRAAIRKKFVFNKERMSYEDRSELFSHRDFWIAFKRDIEKFNGKGSFSKFMHYYSDQNPKAARKLTDSKTTPMGKYYLMLPTFTPKLIPLYESVVPEGVEASKSMAMKHFVYKTAFSLLRKDLLARFPNEFKIIAEAQAKQEAHQNILPSDALSNEESYVVRLLVERDKNGRNETGIEIVNKTLKDFVESSLQAKSISLEQAAILRTRFGLLNSRPATIEEIEGQFNIEKEVVISILEETLTLAKTYNANHSPTRERPQEISQIEDKLDPLKELQEVIDKSRNPRMVILLRAIKDIYDPEEFRKSRRWTKEELCDLYSKLPLRADRVDFQKINLSPYIAKIVQFIVDMETFGVEAFDPEEVQIYSILKENVSFCIGSLDRIDKENPSLADLFEAVVRKTIHQLL